MNKDVPKADSWKDIDEEMIEDASCRDDDKKQERKKETGYIPFEIWLGTFFDNHFKWTKVSSHDNFKDAYQAYKKYVNKQLQYTEKELKKVWDTGRLDIELKRGKKTINWVGIFARETTLEVDEGQKDKGAEKEDKKEEDKE